MTEDGKYCLSVWAIVLVAFVSLVAGITYYNCYEAEKIAQLVLSGTPALEARCALGETNTNVCAILATKTTP